MTIRSQSPARKRKSSTPASREDIKRLVTSWGGFEKLVAELSQTGNVTVEHNVILEGKSGAKRQIDVLIRHTQGLYEHIVIVECKYWNKSVSRIYVDALAKSVDEVNAAKGVIFSTVGFQAGAITQAKTDGIDLFTIRLPTNREWGNPGKHIDFFVQIVAKGIRNIELKGTLATGEVTNIAMNLDFDKDGRLSSKTEIMRPINEAPENYPKTLEDLIISGVNQAVREAWKSPVIQDGEKWTRKFWCSASFKPATPIMMVRPNGTICIIPEIIFDLGICVSQFRYTFDRGDRFAFVFALDDHVKNVVRHVSRENQSEFSVVGLYEDKSPDPGKGPVLANSSVMTIGLAVPIAFENFINLAKGEVVDSRDD